jgi:hypothetical protein
MLARPRQVTRNFIPLALREIHAVGNSLADDSQAGIFTRVSEMARDAVNGLAPR